MKPTLEGPGPGMYSIDENLRKSGFGFGTSKRPELGASKSAARNPGPGQYTDKTQRKGSSCTIRKRPTSSLVNSSKANEPGPGQYNSDVSVIRP